MRDAVLDRPFGRLQPTPSVAVAAAGPGRRRSRNRPAQPPLRPPPPALPRRSCAPPASAIRPGRRRPATPEVTSSSSFWLVRPDAGILVGTGMPPLAAGANRRRLGVRFQARVHPRLVFQQV